MMVGGCGFGWKNCGKIFITKVFVEFHTEDNIDMRAAEPRRVVHRRLHTETGAVDAG